MTKDEILEGKVHQHWESHEMISEEGEYIELNDVHISMEEYAEQKCIEFADWIAKCCYHKTDMDECDLENRGENDYSVLRYDDNDNAIETIYVKDSKELYKVFLAHTG